MAPNRREGAHIIGRHTGYAASLTSIQTTSRAAVFYRRAIHFKRGMISDADDGESHSALNPFERLRTKRAATW
jgi:hypothetical protein